MEQLQAMLDYMDISDVERRGLLQMSATLPAPMAEGLARSVSDRLAHRLQHRMSSTFMSPDDHLELIKTAKERHERLKTALPKSLRPLPPQMVVQGNAGSHQRTEALEEAPSTNGSTVVRTTMCGDLKTSSIERLLDLTRVEVKDLQYPKVHRGQYFLCRVASRPAPEVGCLFAGVSPAGDAITVSLYNLQPLPRSLGASKTFHWDDYLPQWTIIAIKEPFVKPTAFGSADAQVNMRVDSPTDIVICDPNAAELEGITWLDHIRGGRWTPPSVAQKSAEAWKKQGNAAFRERQYLQAETAYTNGLTQHPSSDATYLFYLNRSANRLASERYAGALEDATIAVDLMLAQDPPLATQEQLKRGFLRRGKSLYAMRRWKAALEAFEAAASRFTGCSDVLTSLKNAERRVQEKTLGMYDCHQLYHQAKKHHRLDVADFFGPLERRSSGLPVSGSGLFATSDIQVGQLLIADKALVAVFPEEPTAHVVSLNLLTNKADDTTQTQLRSELAYIQRFQPSTRKDVNILFGSAPQTSSRDKYDYIDPEHNDLVVTFNSFSLGESSTGNEGILSKDTGTGLFTKASMINHSCEPNATWYLYGDFMMIRALRPIRPGEEVFISYIEATGYQDRTEGLKHWFAECKCGRCARDRQISPAELQRRQRLRRLPADNNKEMEAAFGTSSKRKAFVTSIEQQIKHLQSTYATDEPVQGEVAEQLIGRLAEFHMLCFNRFRSQKTFKVSAVKALRQGLKATGMKLLGAGKTDPQTGTPFKTLPKTHLHLAMKGMFNLALVEQWDGDHGACETWIKGARLLHDIMYGAGLFEEMQYKCLDVLNAGKP